MHETRTPPPYELDIAPDGDQWRYRKRWRTGLRRFLPSFWHATDDAGLRVLKREQRPDA
jgi:hypothetical protein